jgi:hypothetical protein
MAMERCFSRDTATKSDIADGGTIIRCAGSRTANYSDTLLLFASYGLVV